MKQFTSPSATRVPGRGVGRPSGGAPHARTSFSSIDFASGPRPPEAVPVEVEDFHGHLGTSYSSITNLQPAPATPHGALIAPEGDPLPAPDPVTGLREYESRMFVNLDDGSTVPVVRDPSTGEWHERPPGSRLARGPALHWAAHTGTWRSRSPGGSSSDSSPSISHSSSSASISHSASTSSLTPAMNNVSLASATRIDPDWHFNRYTLQVSSAVNRAVAFPGKRPVMMGNERYFIDVNFGNSSGAVPAAPPTLFSVNARGQLAIAGRVESNGLYRLNDGRHFLPVGTEFCRVEFDSSQLRWKILDSRGLGAPDIRIEMGGASDTWVPMMSVDNVAGLFQLGRNDMGYTGLVGPVDLVNNSLDRRVYTYMQSYLRQIIGTDSTIRLAPVAHKGALVDDYIWRNGYPYDCLTSIYSAKAAGLPLPPGMPVFDAFQGLATVGCSENGGFNLTRVSREMQLCYPDRTRSLAEDQLLNAWKQKRDAKDNKAKGALNEQMYEARLTEDGYTLLAGGTCGGGQNGLDRVFEGPAGHIYILEAKHVSSDSAGKLSDVSLGSTSRARQMTDRWVSNVLALSDTSTPAARAVSEALTRGQLFKLLGVTTQEGRLILFKINMSLVDI